MGEITERILRTLENQGMNQKEFCEIIDVAQSTFTNWKTRETDPPSGLIVLIAKTLKVSINFLLTGKDNQDAETNRRFAEIRRKYEPLSKYYDHCSEEGQKEIAYFLEYAVDRWRKEDDIRRQIEEMEDEAISAPSSLAD
jgi:transcriptional regulator with XRE-family HTH domain